MKSLEQKKKEAPIKRIQDHNGKWNLVKKNDESVVSDIWFDNLGTWSHYSKNENIDIFGWDGLVYLEAPIKTGGAYPYSVLATGYHYSSNGELLEVFESRCGIWSDK